MLVFLALIFLFILASFLCSRQRAELFFPIIQILTTFYSNLLLSLLDYFYSLYLHPGLSYSCTWTTEALFIQINVLEPQLFHGTPISSDTISGNPPIPPIMTFTFTFLIQNFAFMGLNLSNRQTSRLNKTYLCFSCDVLLGVPGASDSLPDPDPPTSVVTTALRVLQILLETLLSVCLSLLCLLPTGVSISY